MVRCDDGEYDVFLDSLDRLSSDESSASEDSLSGYEIWVLEPTSVEERRQKFLVQMGFSEFASTTSSSSKLLGLDRLMSSDDTRVEEASERCCCPAGHRDEANFMSCRLDGFQEDQRNPSLARQLNTEKRPKKKKMSTWWNRFLNNNNKERGSKIKVLQKNKRCLDLTAPYVGQEIRAHNGLIWTVKFSPDGQYLASGGEDGVVRVWHVRAVDYLTSCESNFYSKHSIRASVIFPDKVFHMEESPIHEFYGHSGDVLDLAWSNSNRIVSSSKDKTVRLWQLGCNQSLHVFHHNDCVTCIQFNPVDDNYFISGSIDGKVRIWGLPEKRVVDWTDVRDVITAICYQPDGQGFMVGSITGTCRSYKTSDEGLLLDAQIHIPATKKTAPNKITGIKFSQENSQRVMISSEDSNIRIYDGVDLTHKYKGLPKSGSQMSASFTSSERHIISLGEDSRVYVWNHEASHVPSSKPTKSTRSCEHFFYQGVSVAIPWPGMETGRGSAIDVGSSLRVQEHPEAVSQARESERFSLGSWFSVDGACRSSATWPEEKLPLWEVSTTEGQNQNRSTTALSETWGLVIVAGGLDGTIRTFHNYGLPVRL